MDNNILPNEDFTNTIIEQRRPFGVYVSVDTEGRIYAINSDAFLEDTTGWIKIDEGSGDKYHHAMNNYLPKPIFDRNNGLRYKLVDNVPVERSEEEMMADSNSITRQPTTEERMMEIESALIELAAMIAGGEV